MVSPALSTAEKYDLLARGAEEIANAPDAPDHLCDGQRLSADFGPPSLSSAADIFFPPGNSITHETRMYGRDGILAHTYMLGPNGQSNGCISFADYNAFLNAFQRGEIDRIVVVDRLGSRPDPQTTGVSEKVKDIFLR